MKSVANVKELEELFLDMFVDRVVAYHETPTADLRNLVFDGVEALYTVHQTIKMLDECGLKDALAPVRGE